MTDLHGPGHTETDLLRSGYRVRVVRGPEGGALMEVYNGTELLDAVWSGSRVSPVLRGAVRGRRAGDCWALAWGQVPQNGRSDVAVVFASGQEAPLPVRPMLIDGAFWVAEAGGDHTSVSVAAGFDRATGRLSDTGDLSPGQPAGTWS
ncbi:hypothetical protein ACFVH6_08340 [Spirillospora sp. NPDC127200]